MFETICTLGTGAFGDVFKVRALHSCCIQESPSGNIRMTMSQSMIKKAKNDLLMCVGGVDKNRTLIKDTFYVIKVVDVAKVPFEAGLEALKEIETMQALDSPYVVGYYDSFIED